MGGERTVITVVFGLVTGFTLWSEKLDPENAHRIMSGYFSIILAEIQKAQVAVKDSRSGSISSLLTSK